MLFILPSSLNYKYDLKIEILCLLKKVFIQVFKVFIKSTAYFTCLKSMLACSIFL